MSEGRAGAVRGGDRLPWVPSGAGSADNLEPLRSLDWQAHVYGACAPPLRGVCERHGIPVHVFAWQDAMHRRGLRRDAVYLIRPDGYVGFADASGTPAPLESYLDRRGLLPARQL